MSMEESKKYKKPLTIEQQVDYLEKSKRVVYKEISKEESGEFLYTHNYINVISPFKYHFAKKDDKGNVIKNKSHCHIYESEVDFVQYMNRYYNERTLYPSLYTALSIFESTFNSILSYEVINHYDLRNEKNIELFIQELMQNTLNLRSVSFSEKQHMLRTINSFPNSIDKYDSVFIFFDRLSFSELATIYKSINNKISYKIFEAMTSELLNLGYTKKRDFDNSLTILIQIRNCIMHSNSLTILIRYYNVKKKLLRTAKDKKRYTKIIDQLFIISSSKENYYYGKGR